MKGPKSIATYLRHRHFYSYPLIPSLFRAFLHHSKPIQCPRLRCSWCWCTASTSTSSHFLFQGCDAFQELLVKADFPQEVYIHTCDIWHIAILDLNKRNLAFVPKQPIWRDHTSVFGSKKCSRYTTSKNCAWKSHIIYSGNSYKAVRILVVMESWQVGK